MRSLRVCNVMIYFMARGERLTRKQVFGNKGNPVYAIWPIGKMWSAAVHNGDAWQPVTNSPATDERAAYDCVMEHFYKSH